MVFAMQRIEASKLSAMEFARELVRKLDSGPRIDRIEHDSKHPLFQSLREMQSGLNVTDIHDPYSVHFAAYDNHVLCGGARLVLPNDALGIPSLQQLSRLQVTHRHCAEISHIVAHHQARRRHTDLVDGTSKVMRPLEVHPNTLISKNHIFILRLLKAIFTYAKQMDIRYIAAVMTESMQHTLKHFHFTFQRIDTHHSDTYYQAPCALCVFDVAQLEHHLFQSGREVGKWFIRSETTSPSMLYRFATTVA